jgi:general secretion pathway protein G
MKATRGFTLVEILIVVVILGILAAIVVPQFTQASTEAKMNSLCSNLQSLRSQIELYKVQHNDTPPTAANFTANMTETSSVTGTASGNKTRTTTYAYGPYLERVPENPFNGLATLRAVADPNSAGTNAAGWAIVDATGEIRADDLVGGVNHKSL